MSSFEFLPRVTEYPREPFLVASGEKLSFEGRFFSAPAYAAQLDKRLFTAQASHPVSNIFKLYINRTANRTISIEPKLSADGYESGTPHYADYILDARDTLSTVFSLHAADSDYTANQFKRAHIKSRHDYYDLDNSSVSGTNYEEYIHQESATLSPSGEELGAAGFYDIDIDEVQWRPFTRPKKIAKINNSLPYEPCFPMAIKADGSLPDFSALDDEKFGQLGIGANASGGLVITGDVLKSGTSVKLLQGSGAQFSSEGDYIESVEWKQYPCGTGLNRYYTPTTSGATISVLGRQAIYSVPNPPSSDSVLLLNVSDTNQSGVVVQNWPGNYHGTSGVDRNGKAHDGVHVVQKLLYAGTRTPGSMIYGRSTINGKIVFGHHIGTETFNIGGQNRNFNSAGFIYNNRNTVYKYAGMLVPTNTTSPATTIWGTANKTFSPINWTTGSSDAVQPRIGSLYVSPPAYTTTWYIADMIQGYNKGGPCTYFRYNNFGVMDRVIYPDTEYSGKGAKITEVIPWTNNTYFLGEPNPAQPGVENWILAPGSTYTGSITVVYYRDVYYTSPPLSFILGGGVLYNDKPNYGFVNANGEVGIQYTDFQGVGVPRMRRVDFLTSKVDRLVPSQLTVVSYYTVGSFPVWYVRKSETIYDRQVQIPNYINFANEIKIITIDPSLPVSINQIYEFGSITWDPDENVNYLYFNTYTGTFSNPSIQKVYFAKMNTDFQIYYINEVDSTDAVFGARMLLMEI